MKAVIIVDFLKIYKAYIAENNLKDDSNKITVQNLVDFLNDHIDQEDRIRLLNS